MSKLRISGPCRLHGEVQVHGAKNSALPLLAASLLCTQPCLLRNCPHLSDVDTAITILRRLGCRVSAEGDAVSVDARTMSSCTIPDALMREMRSSIIFLGAIIGRMGEASLSFPGGCELGPRPIDLHLQALLKRRAFMRLQDPIIQHFQLAAVDVQQAKSGDGITGIYPQNPHTDRFLPQQLKA